jgi:hypothetical protein
MRIVQQMLTEQNMMTTPRTDLCTMSGKMANETATSDEEQICVII